MRKQKKKPARKDKGVARPSSPMRRRARALFPDGTVPEAVEKHLLERRNAKLWQVALLRDFVCRPHLTLRSLCDHHRVPYPGRVCDLLRDYLNVAAEVLCFALVVMAAQPAHADTVTELSWKPGTRARVSVQEPPVRVVVLPASPPAEVLFELTEHPVKGLARTEWQWWHWRPRHYFYELERTDRELVTTAPVTGVPDLRPDEKRLSVWKALKSIPGELWAAVMVTVVAAVKG